MGTIAQIFESGQHSSKKGLFNNLVMLARVDGKVDSTEIELLSRFAKKLSLTAEQVKEIIEHPDEYPMIPPVSREDRCERFLQFVKMMNVDGKISEREIHLVAKYGIELGFENEEVQLLEPRIIAKVIAGESDEQILSEII